MGSTVQSHSAIWQFCSHEKSPSAALCARKGPIFYNIAKFLCYSQKRLGIKLKSQQICDRWGIFIDFLQTDTSVCLCTCFVCVFMWLCSRVHNAWPCWEEWLLYSCLVGAMGARAVSLGSCMDGLRRSPSFIKRTPTCRIDLAKKQGGNSSSSVFPNHKSLGGVPPRERWHHCQRSSPLGQQKGQGRDTCSYSDPEVSSEMRIPFV